MIWQAGNGRRPPSRNFLNKSETQQLVLLCRLMVAIIGNSVQHYAFNELLTALHSLCPLITSFPAAVGDVHLIWGTIR